MTNNVCQQQHVIAHVYPLIIYHLKAYIHSYSLDSFTECSGQQNVTFDLQAKKQKDLYKWIHFKGPMQSF